MGLFILKVDVSFCNFYNSAVDSLIKSPLGAFNLQVVASQ